MHSLKIPALKKKNIISEYTKAVHNAGIKTKL